MKTGLALRCEQDAHSHGLFSVSVHYFQTLFLCFTDSFHLISCFLGATFSTLGFSKRSVRLSTRVLGSGPGLLLLALPFTPEAATLMSGRAGVCASGRPAGTTAPGVTSGTVPQPAVRVCELRVRPSGLHEGPGAPSSSLDLLLPLFLSPDPGSYSCFREGFGGIAPSISSELN